MLDQLDIMRTSASRVDLFKYSTEAWRKFIKFSGKLRWMVHEDVLNDQRGSELVMWAKQNDYEVIVHRPPIGQGRSLQELLNRVKTKYVLNCEDDFAPIREIDLDLAISLMESNPKVNQICFNKRQTMSGKPGFKKLVIDVDGHKLTTNPHWALIPALWRTDWIRPQWVPFSQGRHWDLNYMLKGKCEHVRPAEWVIENIGTYYMGDIGENQFTEHLGMLRSVREGVEQKNW